MSEKADGRQSYKILWERETRKRRFQLEILRRTTTYKRLFEMAFTEYLRFTYPNNANLPTLKTDPDIRAKFLGESFEGIMLSNSLKMEFLLDVDVLTEIQKFAYQKSVIQLVHSLAGTKPRLEEIQRETLRICKPNHPSPGASESKTSKTRSIMDVPREGRYLTIEIDLFNPQEDIRAAMDFWVFDFFWKAVNPNRQRQTRGMALDDKDLEIFDLKTSGKPVQQTMREWYPETKGKDPNDDSDARRIYRRLLSRVNTVEKLIEQEDNRLKALMKTDSFLIDLMAQIESNQHPSTSPKPTVDEVKEMIEERKSRLYRPKPQLRPMQEPEEEKEDEDEDDYLTYLKNKNLPDNK